MDQQQLDPAVIQAVLAMQAQQPEQARIARQHQLADQLRAEQRGGLQGIQAGRRYVGPGAANLIGNIGQSFMAQRLQGQGDAASKALGDERTRAMAQFFNALRAGSTLSNNTAGPNYSPQGHGAPF